MADGVGGRGRRDRRATGSAYRGRPRSSPASLVVLTVAGVLMATAAASLLFGGGHTDATPHGRLLGTLEAVADGQASYYGTAGRFTWHMDELGVEEPEGVELWMTRAGGYHWEARATSREHALSCVQAGRVEDGVTVRDEPVCYVAGD